jgi:hypothetical protein
MHTIIVAILSGRLEVRLSLSIIFRNNRPAFTMNTSRINEHADESAAETLLNMSRSFSREDPSGSHSRAISQGTFQSFQTQVPASTAGTAPTVNSSAHPNTDSSASTQDRASASMAVLPGSCGESMAYCEEHKRYIGGEKKLAEQYLRAAKRSLLAATGLQLDWSIFQRDLFTMFIGQPVYKGYVSHNCQKRDVRTFMSRFLGVCFNECHASCPTAMSVQVAVLQANMRMPIRRSEAELAKAYQAIAEFEYMKRPVPAATSERPQCLGELGSCPRPRQPSGTIKFTDSQLDLVQWLLCQLTGASSDEPAPGLTSALHNITRKSWTQNPQTNNLWKFAKENPYLTARLHDFLLCARNLSWEIHQGACPGTTSAEGRNQHSVDYVDHPTSLLEARRRKALQILADDESDDDPKIDWKTVPSLPTGSM